MDTENKDRLRALLPETLRQRLGTAYYTLSNTLTLSAAGLPRHTEPGVNLFGQLTESSGVGQSARLLAQACRTAGIPLTLHALRSVSGTETDPGLPEELFAPDCPYDANLFVFNADCSEYFLRQAGAGVLKGRRNIAHWAWELAEFPARFAPAFRRYDEIWTLSGHSRDAIAERSPVPVRVIPYGIAPRPDPVLTRADFGLPPEGLLFLSMFDAHSVAARKNPLGAAEAYCRAFPRPQGDTALVLKANGSGAVPAELRTIAASRRDIFLLEGTWERPRSDALLSLCDVFLSLHRAEGFGLPIAEAMALGKCAAVTGWSGNMDYCTAENSCLVPCSLVPVGGNALPPYDASALWAEPDLDAAADILRTLRDDPGLRARLGEAARAVMEERYSPAAAAAALRRRLLP